MAFDGQKQSGSGVGSLHLIDALPLPNERIFTSMLDGRRNQQLARGLAFSTIEGRPVAAARLGLPPRQHFKDHSSSRITLGWLRTKKHRPTHQSH